ncbi:aldehyde dehydrogenase [Burkholderia sp. MSh2]|uniref:Aldehyde dehydrogenase n=2 Tax=Burkholderiaceae TaxID=119060 RepID=A0A6J5F6Y5_9BURK|nr:aldehyde dehydrogenase [Burkholderia sp. MSh2]CAB3773362.1 Putative aldehyde dehydrogenase AldA [Burkholderia paludis]VWC45167.1 aldehyde dehydrogenase [Burkholderia paludis]
MSFAFDNDFRLLIDGQQVEGAATFNAFDPATEEVIAAVPDTSRAQLDEAVDAARQAFPSWAATPVAERQRAVASIAGVLMTHQEAFAALLTREQGKPLDRARDEIAAAAYWCAEFAKLTPPVDIIEDSDEKLVRVRHVPLGVVGAIVPWNFPIILAFWKIAPALVAGNTIVVKPSPFTSLTTLKIGALLCDVLPKGVLNVVSGGDALGPWMSGHPGIDKISFTGSTPTGRKVMESASSNLKRLTLELGGNDAAIVMPDVDVDAIAPVLFWGAFSNSAQFCLAIKRLYIHEDIYDRLRDRLAEIAKETRMGPGDEDGVQLGPVQNRAQFERLKRLLEDSRTQGHAFPAGGEIGSGKGFFFPATLVDNPPDDSRVVREEPFGPILPLLKFRDVDDVIRRANDSEYGLGGSVWSRDEAQAQAIAERMQTGTVWINEIHSLSPLKPMAGHKQSGIGVENGLVGLLEYTVPQTITLNRQRA